jgi:hypothetical protein
MNTKRVSSGRLVRVDQRRRGRKWKIALGIAAGVIFIIFVTFALIYKNKWTHPRKAKPPVTPTVATASLPPTAAGTAAPPTAEGEVRTLLVNSTKVPQRYGNALAALEQLNVASGNVYRLEQSRPTIAYADKTIIYYRDGFAAQAEALAKALGGTPERKRLDLTVTCGQDVSKLILEAMAKNVPAAENINVEVLNGSGIEGAAAKVKERLEANGYRVITVGNAAAFDFKTTTVETPEDKKDAALKLAALFGLGENALEPAPYDVKIVVADDYGVTPGKK